MRVLIGISLRTTASAKAQRYRMELKEAQATIEQAQLPDDERMRSLEDENALLKRNALGLHLRREALLPRLQLALPRRDTVRLLPGDLHPTRKCTTKTTPTRRYITKTPIATETSRNVRVLETLGPSSKL